MNALLLQASDPALNLLLNLIAVLLHEEHMTISVNTCPWQFKVDCLITARLFKVADRAVIIGHMIRSLRSNQKDGLACQVRELSWRGIRSLEYTLGMVLVRRRMCLLHEIHRGNGNRGSVGEWNVS